VRPPILVSSCALALVLAGCAAPPAAESDPKPNAGVVCDRFELLAVLEGDQLLLSLDTDLPDETVLMVSAARSYHEGSPEQEKPLNYLSERSTVGEWRVPHKVSLTHGVWAKLLDERARLSTVTGEPLNIKRTNGDLDASFTVPINQTDPRFGKGNENLRGKKVPTTGLRTVRVEKKIPYPLPVNATRPARTYVARDALESGVTYQIPKEVPLMPSRDPADPLEALKSLRRIPAQTLITVLTVDRRQASNPWYRVKAVGPAGAALGTGWINSIALIGPDIVRVR